MRFGMRRWVLCGLAGTAALLGGCAGIKGGGSPHSGPGADLRGYLEERRLAAAKPGLAVVAVDRDGAYFEEYLGWADLERRKPVGSSTIFTTGSVSKVVVGIAVMRLVEEGRLELDADVNGYLPYPVRNPAYPDSPINLRMLLNHTAGIRSNWASLYGLIGKGDPELSLGALCEAYLAPRGKLARKGNFSGFEPGRGFEYSNIGVSLAAHIVERAAGRDFADWCRLELFEPLRMESTSWTFAGLDPERLAQPYARPLGLWYASQGAYSAAFWPAGFLKTTAGDLGRLLRMVLRKGELDGARILEPATLEAMLLPDPSIRPDHWQGQGLIFQERTSDGHAVLGHTGGFAGVASLMLMSPETERGVVLLANGDWLPSTGYDRLDETPLKEIAMTLIFGRRPE